MLVLGLSYRYSVPGPRGGPETEDWGPETKFSEIELPADFEQTRVHDALRRPPHGIVGVLLHHGIVVEQVVDVQIRLCAAATEPERLPKTKVELVDAVAVDVTGIEQIDRDVLGSAGRR